MSFCNDTVERCMRSLVFGCTHAHTRFNENILMKNRRETMKIIKKLFAHNKTQITKQNLSLTFCVCFVHLFADFPTNLAYSFVRCVTIVYD